MEFLAESAVATFNFAKEFAQNLKTGAFVALFGGLGVGKTMFTKGLCEGLGFAGHVSSPTFSIINEYKVNRGSIFKKKFLIVHCDMYRIAGEDDLESVGFFDYLAMPNRIIITEWSENIIAFLPQNIYRISFIRVSETARLIKVMG